MEINQIEKRVAIDFISKYHYLKDKPFMSNYSFGLWDELEGRQELVGVAVFGQVGGISAIKGWFGLTNSENIMELTRLCMRPDYNKGNSTSFLLGRSLRQLKRKVRAVISLADASIHCGYIYQACNFSYHGLSDYKTDFYTEDGRLNPRGKTADIRGVWLPRTRKHRYLFKFDNSLVVRYPQQAYPKGEFVENYCCNDTGKIYDARFKVWYQCVCQNDTGEKRLTILKNQV